MNMGRIITKTILSKEGNYIAGGFAYTVRSVSKYGSTTTYFTTDDKKIPASNVEIFEPSELYLKLMKGDQKWQTEKNWKKENIKE